MSVKSIMDPQTPVTAESDCISHIYTQMLAASDVQTIEQAESSLNWCGGIQHQISTMVHGLSNKKAIHSDVGSDALEYVEQDYESLITFLSGLGLAIAGVSERLRCAKAQIEAAQFGGEA